MADAAIAQLLQQAAGDSEPLLLVLDENVGTLPPPLHAESRAISNRYDVCMAARRNGWPCSFSDFVISRELLLDCRRALYRVSKEKRVVEHVLQSLWQQLPVGGELHVAGYKDEGIKTFAKRMQAAWDRADVNDIREFTTPEMFGELKMQLTERGASPNHTDVVSIDAELLGVETNTIEHVASVRFHGMIREAEHAPAEPFSEIWVLTKPLAGSQGWLLAGLQQG